MIAAWHIVIRGVALAAMAYVPWWIVARPTARPDRPVAAALPIIPVTAPSAGLDQLRDMFSAPDTLPRVAIAGRPVLIGIAGRLPDDVVALVRDPGGATHTMRRGDKIAEWRIETIGTTTATFTRENEQFTSLLEPPDPPVRR